MMLQSVAGWSNRFPLVGRGGVQDGVDLVEGQAYIPHHADEDEPAERLRPVPALTILPSVGIQQAASFVVADGRGRDLGSPGYLADRH